MITVELKRPELSEAKWTDTDGKDTDKGLVGEAVKLGVTCNKDTEEGAGVTFKVYRDGADPKRDQPVEEIASSNQGGKAEAEWTYRYKHDPENPLKEKPKFFFTAVGKRCQEVKSGNVEMGMEIDIPFCYDNGECIAGLEYTLTGVDGTEEKGKTGTNGRIQNDALLPGNFEISIDWKAYKPGEEEPENTDLDAVSAGCKKVIVPYNTEQLLLKHRPGQEYLIIIDRQGLTASR
jgi:hypothetical protein